MVKAAFVSLSLVCVAQAYLPPLHGPNTRKSDLVIRPAYVDNRVRPLTVGPAFTI